MTRWWWWEGRWKLRIPGHVWTCHDNGRGNGRGHSHGGGRLSSLWLFITNSLISQDFNKKKKQKRTHTRLEMQTHLVKALVLRRSSSPMVVVACCMPVITVLLNTYCL